MTVVHYYNPSQISAYQDCPSKWSRDFVHGGQAPDVPWGRIVAAGEDWREVASPRQRATSLGTAVHAVLERWFKSRGGEIQRPDLAIDWESLPGQVALSGLHLLPDPKQCDRIIPEVQAFLPCASVPGLEDWPHLGLRGTRDLVVRTTQRELQRLGLVSPSGWLLLDYKTTASIRDWAKTPADLLVDAQGTVYPLTALVEFELPAMPARWAYFESKKVRRAEARDFTATIEHTTAQARRLLPIVAEIDRHTVEKTPADRLAQNPEACEKFAGCPHHVSRGGQCPGGRANVKAARWVTIRQQGQRPRKRDQAPMTAPLSFAEMRAQRAREQAAKAAAQSAPAPVEAEPETEVEAGDADEAEQEAPPPPAKAKPGPKPGGKAKTPPPPPPTPTPAAPQAGQNPGLVPGDFKVELTIAAEDLFLRMPVPPEVQTMAAQVVAAIRNAAAGS